MLEKCQTLAESQMQRVAKTALGKMQTSFKQEIARLHDLRLRHTSTVESPLEREVESRATALESVIRGVRLRLDSMRVILRRA